MLRPVASPVAHRGRKLPVGRESPGEKQLLDKKKRRISEEQLRRGGHYSLGSRGGRPSLAAVEKMLKKQEGQVQVSNAGWVCFYVVDFDIWGNLSARPFSVMEHDLHLRTSFVH